MAAVTTEMVKGLGAAAPAAARPEPYRLTVELYARMIAAGAFRDKEPMFLWRGQLVEKMTKGPRHDNALTDLNAILLRAVPGGWHVRPVQSVVLTDDTMPEPDFTVVRGRSRDDVDRYVTANDVALVVEVSDSSLAVDSGVVLEDYAREAIPAYWVVNIPGRTIDVYTQPTGRREAGPPYYAERHCYRKDEEVPLVLDGCEVGRVPVREVLP